MDYQGRQEKMEMTVTLVIQVSLVTKVTQVITGYQDDLDSEVETVYQESQVLQLLETVLLELRVTLVTAERAYQENGFVKLLIWCTFVKCNPSLQRTNRFDSLVV